MTETKADTQRRYRERHPDRVAASKRKYYEKNSAKLKEKQKSYTRTRTPEENARRKLVDRGNPKGYLTGLVATAKARATARGIDFSLTRDLLYDRYLLQGGLCALTGQPMTTVVGQGRVKTNISLDRIDSRMGYTSDNVQLVCDLINTMKQDLSIEELREICRLILARTET